ncbi:MAG: hypothetical protein OXK78_06740, partial [Caldilineaceae bacterium]|nr:hypothetical protein [Caldilineaceae bacterium]
LQRKLRVGHNRASRLVEQLEAAGILGPDRGRSLGREVYLKTAGEGDPEREEEVPAPLAASPSFDHDSGSADSGSIDNGSVGNGSAGSESIEGEAVDSGQAELPPPPEKGDAPPRIWM